jgi:hypothetical protein
MEIIDLFVFSFLVVILVILSIILSKMNVNEENYIGCTSNGEVYTGPLVRPCGNCKGSANCNSAGCKVNSDNKCVL